MLSFSSLFPEIYSYSLSLLFHDEKNRFLELVLTKPMGVLCAEFWQLCQSPILPDDSAFSHIQLG
jgi:hypothetical protein